MGSCSEEEKLTQLQVHQEKLRILGQGAGLGSGNGKSLRTHRAVGEFWLNQPSRLLAEGRPGGPDIMWEMMENEIRC